jgi:hypothetical protein
MTQSNRHEHFEVPNNDADVKPSVARSCVFNVTYLANQKSTMNWIFQNTKYCSYTFIHSNCTADLRIHKVTRKSQMPSLKWFNGWNVTVFLRWFIPVVYAIIGITNECKIMQIKTQQLLLCSGNQVNDNMFRPKHVVIHLALSYIHLWYPCNCLHNIRSNGMQVSKSRLPDRRIAYYVIQNSLPAAHR